jgi:hypothetical protein
MANGEQADDGGAGAGNESGSRASALVSSLPPWFAVAIGIAVGVAFMFAIHSLWALADDGGAQVVWDRRFGLYQTLSSLFGAIVGAMFGVGVLQPRVNRAEDKAAAAEKEAKKDARAAASASAGVEAAVELERTKILQFATRASRTEPQILIDQRDDDPGSAFRMLNLAADQPGPVNVIRAGTAGEGGGVISLVDLVEAIDRSRQESNS